MRRIAIVPAMRSDAGGYQEDTATQHRHQPKDIGGQLGPGPGCQLMQRLPAAAVLCWCWGCAG